MSRQFVAWLAALVGACVIAGSVALYSVPAQEPASLAGSVAKIVLAGGHGSGVHIGGGYILSAEHVASDQSVPVTIRMDDGTERTAVVLWTNYEHDIAMLKIEDATGLDHSPLACRVPEIHESVTAKGNPLFMEFITTRGWIAGAPMTAGNVWRSVVPISIPVAQGMSGGALFDVHGYVVGIVVGSPAQSLGAGHTYVGMALAVDGKSICRLLARA